MQSGGCSKGPMKVNVGNFVCLTKPHHQNRSKLILPKFGQLMNPSEGGRVG